MSTNIIDLQEWAERRARRNALKFLSEWGWLPLPSGIEPLISLMELPAGVWGEATATKVRNKLIGMLPQAQADMGIDPMPGTDMSHEQWVAVRERIDELCAEQATGTTGVR